MVLSATAKRSNRLPEPQQPRVNILLVEDCKSDVFLVERMLEDAGCDYRYNITDVPRLTDAFTRLSECQYDLVMLDLNLIDIDGLASVTALHAEAPELPIIVYSGLDDARMKERALMCGAAHYLVKGRESGMGLGNIIHRAIVAQPR